MAAVLSKSEKARLEKLVMSACYAVNKREVALTSEQEQIIKAIYKTIEYLEMTDYLHGSNHAEIFKRVYLTLNTVLNGKGEVVAERRKTMVAFAQDLYVGENTLSRWTNDYIRCFEKNLSNLTENT